jgi:hypothetical protein
MSTATGSAGFFALPAELHLEVSKHILADVAEDPCPRELAPYAGLLLSCKQIKSDFEHEFAKDFNKYLERLLTYPEVYSNSTHSLTTWRVRQSNPSTTRPMSESLLPTTWINGMAVTHVLS